MKRAPGRPGRRPCRPVRLLSPLLIGIALLLPGGVAAAGEGTTGGVPPHVPWTVEEAPHVRAAAAVLLDLRSGQVLWSRNALQPRDPASTTKVMTALLAIERGRLDDWVTVSRRAAGTGGSRMGLARGERYRLATLLQGLLLASGNDAAVAIAEHLAGDVPTFARWMNDRARQLGLTRSSFRNPHGLTAAGHVTTALDLARLTRAAMSHPVFRTLIGTGWAEVCGRGAGGGERRRPLANTNRLLDGDPSSLGGKTGTTTAAGQCLVTAVERPGGEWLAVVLRSSDRWGDAQRLFAWADRHFVSLPLLPEGEVLRALPHPGGRRLGAIARRSLWVSLPREPAPIAATWEWIPREGGWRAGDEVGRVSFHVDGVWVGGVPLFAAPLEGERAGGGREWNPLRWLRSFLHPS